MQTLYAILIAGGIITVVYIDVLIFTNTIINYLILLSTEKFTRKKLKNSRLILASFIGSLFSLFIFTDQRSILFSMMLRVISTAVITVIAFRYNSIKELSLNALSVFCISLIFSGMMIFIWRVFHPPNLLIINDIVYFEFQPLVMILVTVIIYGAVLLAEKLFRPRVSNTAVQLRFTVGGKEYACVGKIDTGCTLREPFSDAPVIIVDRQVLTIDESACCRIIPYTSLGNSSVLFGIPADHVVINSKSVDTAVYIAAADLRHSPYQAIIHSDIIR